VLQKLTVANIMTRKVITATPDVSIERAARMIREHKIGSLPVLKDDKLVGMITASDLMEVFLTALGLSEDTRRFSILVRDRIGVVAEVGKWMQEAEISIRSIMIVPLMGHEEVWQLIVRVNQEDFSKAIDTLQGAGFKIVTDYVEDLTPFLPE
jgi:acetoin utilization protein AcuB